MRQVGVPGAELVRRHLDGGGEPGRRRLGEQAHPAVRVRVGPPRRPRVEEGARDDARRAVGREARGDVGAERVRGGHEGRVHVRLPRVRVGRHEEPRPPRAHLVHVVHDLGVPASVQVLDGQPRLLLRERVPVAVVVVADVRVVEHRGRRVLERSPLLAAVPLGHELRAVGVVRREHEEHDAVEGGAGLRIVARREVVKEAQRGERAPDLCRVDRERHRHDRAAVLDEPAGLRVGEPARIGDPRVRLADLLEPRVVRLGRDGDHHEGTTLRGLADLLDLDPVGRGIEGLQVREHLRPVGELAVVARHEAEHGLGRGDGGGRP